MHTYLQGRQRESLRRGARITLIYAYDHYLSCLAAASLYRPPILQWTAQAYCSSWEQYDGEIRR